MYNQITDLDTVGKIFVVPIENLNNVMRGQASSIFGDINAGSFIIYTIISENEASVLGYFNLDNLSITESPRFAYLNANTIAVNKKDSSDELERMPSIHISQWVFDNSLKNKSALNSIFQAITAFCYATSENTMLWTDSNDLYFYPLRQSDIPFGHNAAIAYFIDKFMNE